MKLKKEGGLCLILLLLCLTSFVTYGFVTEETSTAFTDVVDPSQMKGTIPMEGGGYNMQGQLGTQRGLTTIENMPLKTKLGTISNAKMENYVFDFGDLVQGKMTSFTDNNLISFKSMFDPDMRVEIIMGKDGWAVINQYDKYGNLINTMTVEMSANNILREGLGKEFGLSDFKPNNNTLIARYERSEDKTRIEAGTLTFTKDGKVERVMAPTKAMSPTEITFNKESGFECITLQQDGTYSFESIEKSFSVTNDNKQDYTVCVNKVGNPVPKPVSQRSAYIDQIKDVIDLQMKVTYKYGNKPLYQGFDDKNLAKIESSTQST